MGAVLDFNAARGRAIGRRAWQGIETDDPPRALYDYEDHLAVAERMLASREKRFPTLVREGRLDASAARDEIEIYRAIVVDWRWICTGEGQPAPIATLDQRRTALDASIRTIAEIARDEGGFSPALTGQADSVIAMRWHLEPGRRTHACAALTHELRRRALENNRESARAD